MKNASGFTVVETLVTVIFVGILGTAGFSLFEALSMTQRDQDRKVAINTIYYNLEEVVKPKLGAYPRTLTPAQLTAMDRKLLTDPAGVNIGEPGSDYRYEATGCDGGDQCEGYTLWADLEREADFIKENR